MLEVANLILVVGEEATVHDVRKKFRCKQCNVKGENTFQIILPDERTLCTLASLELSLCGGGPHV